MCWFREISIYYVCIIFRVSCHLKCSLGSHWQRIGFHFNDILLLPELELLVPGVNSRWIIILMVPKRNKMRDWVIFHLQRPWSIITQCYKHFLQYFKLISRLVPLTYRDSVSLFVQQQLSYLARQNAKDI